MASPAGMFPTMAPNADFGVIPTTASRRSLPILPPAVPPSAPMLQSSMNSQLLMQAPSVTLQTPPTIATLPPGSVRPQQAYPVQAYPVQAYPLINLPMQAPLYSISSEDAYPQEPVKEAVFHEDFRTGSTDYAFLFFGLFVAILVSIIPIWDGISLLNDPVWVYMCGKVLPITLIVAVAAAIVFFFVVMDAILLSSRGRTARTEQTLLNVVILFILLLGTIFVTMSTPIQSDARLAKSELMYNCNSGVLTQPLYQAYQDLQAIRKKPSCIANVSVEQCDGYKDSPLNGMIKGMEQRMQCSGFCFIPKVPSANATATPVDPANVSYGYPVGLFSKAGMQGSCSSMAARDMAGFAQDMGTRLAWEGYFLMAAAVVQGFMLVGGSCVRQELGSRKYFNVEAPLEADGYGTMK